jgi:PilZ domain-containing protein
MIVANERRKDAKRVAFENPLDVRVMATDGTWCRDCQLIDVSETGARIRLTGSAVNDTEFFLLLTKSGDPVFRMCMRRWVDGTLVGVSFHRDFIATKPLAQLRREARLV